MTERNHIHVALSFGLMLSFVFPAIVRTQGQSTPRFSTEIGRLIKRKEPEWRYNQGFCTCPPLLPSQLADEVATWERKRANGTRERVGLMIVTIGSKTEAIDFMKGFASGRWQGHSRVQKYQIGDEAFL